MTRLRPAHAGLRRGTAMRLTSAARNRLSAGAFALPGRRYPIQDASHARNALARVAQYGSATEKERVRAAVHRRYPGIGRKHSVPSRRRS